MLRTVGRIPRGFFAAFIALACLVSAHAGGEDGNALDFVRAFLQEYPRFRADGTMTSTLVGKPPYRCRVEMVFDKQDAVLFSYNTDASKNIIPYDYNYADRRLQETVYNRDRSQVVKTTEVGAPNRTVFNFVWDVLREAEQGAGLNSLVFTGLMSLDRDDSKRGTTLILRRRIPAGPIESVKFTFDDDKRLRLIDIVQGNKDQHHLEIRRFRKISGDTDSPKPAPPRH